MAQRPFSKLLAFSPLSTATSIHPLARVAAVQSDTKHTREIQTNYVTSILNYSNLEINLVCSYRLFMLFLQNG